MSRSGGLSETSDATAEIKAIAEEVDVNSTFSM